MTDYKPGQIAKATVRGVPDVTVILDGDSDWCSPTRIAGCYFHGPDDVTDVRPLVVLDLEGFNALALADTFRKMGFGAIARQIEAQTRPAIEEPKGLGAVVEDERGDRWLRVCEHMGCNSWAPVVSGSAEVEGGKRRYWSSITPVRVLPERVEP